MALLVMASGCGDDGGEDGQPDAATSDSDATVGQPAALPFGDQFDGSALDSQYRILHGEATAGIEVADGHLATTVTTQSVWWMDHNNAPFIYRLFDDENFAVTATVRARDAGDDTQPIASGYHYTGPMIRLDASDPDGPQNFTFVAVGYQSDCEGANDQCVETKSTEDNDPTISRHRNNGSGDSQLRLCKVGSEVRAYARAADSTDDWVERAVWSRPDLTGLLQVGIMAFSFELGGVQLRTMVDEFSVRPVTAVDECDKLP